MWGATGHEGYFTNGRLISIHAPRVGSDGSGKNGGSGGGDFNPRSPCGERRSANNTLTARRTISIHAPRVGSDHVQEQEQEQSVISIHAPRVGSDARRCICSIRSTYFNPRSPCGERRSGTPRFTPLRFIFQSTLPVWGATVPDVVPHKCTKFQSTLPVWGATACSSSSDCAGGDFNPRSPCGERR